MSMRDVRFIRAKQFFTDTGGISKTRDLFDGLSHSNIERTADGKLEPLCLVARKSDKAIVGGIYGEITELPSC